MEQTIATPVDYRPVFHRTLHALCERLRREVPQVVPPVHLFDIPPQVMQGLFAVAWVTRAGELHRCVLPYRDAAMLATERRPLAQLLLWGELSQAEGRLEIGVHTGGLLRYFLPNAPAGTLERRHEDRCHADWLAAAERSAGPCQLWRVAAEDAAAVAGISAGGVHYLVRLRGDGGERLEHARQRLGCRIVGSLPASAALARDVLGAWRE